LIPTPIRISTGDSVQKMYTVYELERSVGQVIGCTRSSNEKFIPSFYTHVS